MKLQTLFLTLLITLTGCVSVLKSDKIVTIKQRLFGVGVMYKPDTQLPEIYLGFSSTVIQIIPTSTNALVNAPRYFDTFDLGQGINPFNTSIIENTGTGDVMIGTNGAGGAVLLKVKPPTLHTNLPGIKVP